MANKYSTPVSSDTEATDPLHQAALTLIGRSRSTAARNSSRVDSPTTRKSPREHTSREVGGAPHGHSRISPAAREISPTTGGRQYACTQNAAARHISTQSIKMLSIRVAVNSVILVGRAGLP